jgi:hypothetical protein
VPYFDDHLGYSGGCEFHGAYVGDPLHRFYQMSQQTLGYHAMLNSGSYSECANPAQPGVGPIDHFLATLPYPTLKNCKPGRYYLLNNYNAGYNLDGPGDRRGPEQPGGVEVHRHLRHLRRDRRLLRLRVHPAGQLLRRRAEGADDRGLPLRQAARSTTPTTTTSRS